MTVAHSSMPRASPAWARAATERPPMSSISGVSQSGAQAAQQAQQSQNKPSAAKAAAAAAQEEANESRRDHPPGSGQGRPGAIRRLARQHKPGAAAQPQQPAASEAPSTSKTATRGAGSRHSLRPHRIHLQSQSNMGCPSVPTRSKVRPPSAGLGLCSGAAGAHRAQHRP